MVEKKTGVRMAGARVWVGGSLLFLGGGVCRGLSGLLGSRLGRLGGDADLDGEEHLDGVLPDQVDHGVEHLAALHAELDDRVALGVGAQVDALFEVVHGVDVVHPLGVDILEQDHALELPHQLGAEHGLPLGVEQVDALPEEVLELFGLDGGLFLVGGVVHLIDGDGPAAEEVPQADEVPVVVVVAGADEAVDGLADDLIDHSGDDGGDVRAVEDLLALLVDDLPLAVGHIVELEDVFTDGEVAALHLGLGALDGIGEHLGGDGGILVHLEGGHHRLDAVAAEEAEQQRQERGDKPQRAAGKVRVVFLPVVRLPARKRPNF